MKHIFTFMVVAGFAAMVSCGPSAEQQAAEQARLDSIKADSIAKVEQAKKDSIAAAEASLAAQAADSLAADSTKVTK